MIGGFNNGDFNLKCPINFRIVQKELLYMYMYSTNCKGGKRRIALIIARMFQVKVISFMRN